MTSKAVISQLEVNERRLKGIYDQLEGGNFKKAIFEADKVLKKNANLLPAKVLKGLALYRLGKSIEAFNLIDEVAKLTPTDENTLNSLSYFYKESNQKNKIVDIYEEAYKKCPNREDICANLFYCHTKNFDFLSQQKVATQLKKINVNHLEYVLWPIISNVLHGVYNNDQRLIKLGEAILARYLNSNSILTPEIVEFLIYTLEKSNKFVECLEWLNGPVLKDVVENNQNKDLFNRRKIEILLKLDRKLETCVLFWDFLKNNIEDVRVWRDYIDVVVNLNLEKENAHSITSVIDKLKTFNKPSMAIGVVNIHLSLKLDSIKHDLSLEFGSKIDKIVEFFVEFGDKPSCLYDIYSFMALDQFSNEERLEIVAKISEHTGPLSVDKIGNTKDIERYFAIEVLKRAVASGNRSDIVDLIAVYDHGLQFSTSISCSEIKPCDNFAKLAASRYYDVWVENPSNFAPLIDAIVLLKRAIEQSPANYNLRLQLSHLFGIIGCSDLLINEFNDLEIKQLMWDSLGYFYILPMFSTPSFQQRVQFLKRNIDRKQKNKIEIEDSLVTCYKLGNYSRIPEIIEFHRDIDASIMTRLSEIELLYVNMVLKSNNCDELFESFSTINVLEVESSDSELDMLAYYSNLKDFRDLETSPDFSRFDKMWNEDHKRISFDNIVSWASHRVLVVRALYSAAKLNMETVVKLDRLISDSSLSFESDISSHYKTMVSCRQQLNDIWTKMEAMTGSYEYLSINLTGCPEPPQHAFNRAYINTFLSCINSMIWFHDTFVRRIEPVTQIDWIENVGMPLKSVVDQVLTSDIENGDLFAVVPQILTKLTVACELFSWLTLTLGLVENMTKPMRPKLAMKRRNKKKKGDICSDTASESKNEQLKSFLESTNFQKLPILLLEMIGNLDGFISQVKSVIGSTELKSPHPILISIGNSWKLSLDDSLNFINVKKIHLDNIKKVFEDESASQCLCQLNELNINQHQ